MYINTDLIVDELKRSYTITQHLPCPSATLRSFRIYDGGELLPEHLYLIRPDQLLFVEAGRSDVAFLCPDVDQPLDFSVNYGLITLRGYADIPALVNKVMGIFETYNRWDEGISASEASLAGIKGIFELSRPVLKGTLVLADNHFNHLTSTADFERDIRALRQNTGVGAPDYVVDDILTDPEYIRLRNSREIFEYPVHNRSGTVPALCCNLFRADETEYSARILYIPDDHVFTDTRRFLLTHLCDRIGIIVNQLSAYAFSAPYFDGLREIIAKSLEKQMPSVILIRSVLKYLQWDVSDSYQLVKVKPFFLEDPKEMNVITRTHLELAVPYSCAIVFDGSIVLVINRTRWEKQCSHKYLREILVSQLRDRLYKAGVSAQFDGFGGLHAAYLEADAALTLGNSEDNMFWYYDFQDYSLDYMLSRCLEHIDKTHLCIPGLIRLMRYDADHGTDYTKSLRTFVEEKYSVTHTADRLYVHRTTLVKHLKKIDEISGMDLDDWKTRLHLCLSLQFIAE